MFSPLSSSLSFRVLDIMMKIVFLGQKALLYSSYWFFGCFVKENTKLWVTGVTEIANITYNTASAFAEGYSVNLSTNQYYLTNDYNFNMKNFGVLNNLAMRLLAGPVLLGYLANRAKHFFYVGGTGFLLHLTDGRDFEFSFLKKRDKDIVACFCGSDIRSLKLSIAHAKEHDLEVMATYQMMTAPKLTTDRHEAYLKKIAASADTYADHIFTAPVDQISYLTRDVHPFLYFYPDERFAKNDAKFDDMTQIRIAHAPSSPFIKGTQIVRAAIKKLKIMGYNIEYTEFMNMPNAAVLAYLKDAHIVLNEFYAFMPSIFGVEAMASHCALLTSADRNMEPTLAEGANEAWFVTRYWEVFDHLKLLLDQPELIKPQADRGYDWAYVHCRTSQSRQRLQDLLQEAV